MATPSPQLLGTDAGTVRTDPRGPAGRLSARAAAVAVLVVFATLSILSGRPASGEISDEPQNFWGVTGLEEESTTNVRSEVWAIEQVGNTIYVGGKFLEVKGNDTFDQPYLAAFHADTGRWIDWWRPKINAPVYALEAPADGSKLFVGGEFTVVNGQNIAAFASLDPATAELTDGWNTRISGGGPAVVRDFDLEQGNLYVVGSFSTAAVNGVQTRVHRAVRINESSGAIDTAWKPVVEGGGVWGVAASPAAGRVYLTGFFSSIDGDVNSGWAAILDDQAGAPVPGMDHIDNTLPDWSYQQDVEVGNGLVFIGGSQHNVHVYRESDFALIRTHMTRNGGDIQDMELVGDRVYVACHCWNFNYEHNGMQYWATPDPNAAVRPIRGIFALDASTGAQIPEFFVNLTGRAGPWAIHGNSSDGCLWTGGDLTTSAGKPVNRFVRLCDEAGPGPAAGPQLTPPAPASCSAVAVDNSDINISWSAVAFADAYVIHRDGRWIDRVSNPDLTAYVDQDARVGANHTYTVFSSGGGNLSDPGVDCDLESGVAVRAVTACAAADASTAAGASVEVSWTRASTDNADGFTVLRSRDGRGYFPVGSVNSPTTSLIDDTVALGSTYRYQVRSMAGAVNAPLTDCQPAVALDFPGPVAPSTCSASLNASVATVEWARAANDSAEAFVIRRSKNGGAYFWAGRAIAPATSWEDPNTSPGNTYQYRVETAGPGSSSDPVGCSGAVSIDGPSLLPVTSCSAAEVDGGIEIGWTRPNGDNAQKFAVYRSRNGGTFFWAGVRPVPGTNWTDANVVEGDEYRYRVRTVGASGTAETSCSPDITFEGVSLDPIAPTSCSVSVNGNDVTISWDRADNDNSVKFTVRRSREGGTFFWAGKSDSPATSFTDAGIASGTYRYTVETHSATERSETISCGDPVTL